jgi:hypothetical protein
MEKFDDLLRLTLEKAKTNRAKFGYSGADRFAQCALVIGPNLESATLPIQWGSNREKRALMTAISLAAKDANASAVLLINDTRWCESEKFTDYFHIAPISEIGLEAWQEEYGEIIRGIYGGSMGNLPRELWNEALIVSGKGPLVGEKSVIAFYREGRNDSVEWIENPMKTSGGDIQTKMYMLDDWWETTTKQ